ncbi:MAG: hypothetical protein ACRD0Z_05460 [Acidimicrobiales bacterium]
MQEEGAVDVAAGNPRRFAGALFGSSFLFFAIASVAVVWHYGEPMSFDLQNYEFYSGYAALHGFGNGGGAALPGQLQTYLDPQVNAIYYLLDTHTSGKVAAAVAVMQSVSPALLSLLVFFALARTATLRFAMTAGYLAGLAAFLAPLYTIELGQSSSDVLLSPLLFGGAALCFRVLAPAKSVPAPSVWRQLRDLALAGVLLGAAAEMKFTLGSLALGVLLGLWVGILVARRVAGWSARRCLALAVTPTVTAAVTATALYLPIGLLLWRRYRDPVFPYWNGVFHSPYLAPGNYRDPMRAAHSAAGAWQHFARLLFGGSTTPNGLFPSGVRSPILWSMLVIVLALLVYDIMRRKRPEALYLETAVVAGFVVWDVVFGGYRYLAPLEMGAVAILLVLLAPLRVPRWALLGATTVGLAVGSVFAVATPVLGDVGFGPSYFGVEAATFKPLAHAGVVIAGVEPLGYFVPYMPSSTQVVRGQSTLDSVMSSLWWTDVRASIRGSGKHWWVVFQDPAEAREALRQAGLPVRYSDCRSTGGVAPARLCRVDSTSP